jgi:hypothetical protein
MEIIRPGEFCRSSDFCNDQNLNTVTLIYKVVKGDPNPFYVELLSRTSEEALIRSTNLNDESALKRAVACGSLAVNTPPRGPTNYREDSHRNSYYPINPELLRYTPTLRISRITRRKVEEVCAE